MIILKGHNNFFKKAIHFFCAHTVIKQFFRILIQNNDIKQVSQKKKCGCVHIFVAIILPHSFEQPIDYEQCMRAGAAKPRDARNEGGSHW